MSVLVFRHVAHEDIGTIAAALERAGQKAEYVDFWADPRAPIDLERAAALVVMGGPMNVDEVDAYPFLTREADAIRTAITRGLPTLGVCLGGQLIARALGARVTRNPQKEIGWYPLDLEPAAAGDPLFRRFRRREVVFQWHGDTFEVPVGARLLATSPLCAHQAFRYGEATYALQFHLEVTTAMIAEWLDEARNAAELAALAGLIDPGRIAQETPGHIAALKSLAAPLFDAFLALAGRR